MEQTTREPKLNPTARIAKNSLVQIVAGVLNKTLGVALVIYAARQLGTAGFGQYAFVLSMNAIFFILTDFGLGTLTTRDLARQPDQDARYFSNIAILRFLLSLLAGSGMVLTVVLLGHPPLIVGLTLVAAFSLFFNSNVDTASAIIYAHQRMEITATVSVIVTTLRVTVSLGALAVGAGVMALIWIHTLAAAVHMVFLFGVLFYFSPPSWSLDLAFWKKMLRQAYPLALANLFSVIYFRVDTIMLASLQGQEAVGLYNAAYRLLEFTLILPAYYGGAIFPVISASYANNTQRFMLIYRRSLKYMWMASLPLAVGTFMLAPKFIQVLYGPDYAASVPVLSILMWTLVLIAVNSINAPYLITMGRQKTITVLVLIGMVCNVIFNALLIPRFGMLGAAWVTLGSEVLTIGLFMWALRKPLALRWRTIGNFLRPAMAAAVMYGVLYFITSWDLGFQIMLGGVVYCLLLWVLRAFDEVDMEIFTRILHPTRQGGIKIT